MTSSLQNQLEQARLNFSRLVREYKKEVNVYIDLAPELPQSLLEDARLYGSRLEMLKRLDIQSGLIWCEVGVDEAIFSANICNICSPAKLYLLDIDTSRINHSNLQGHEDTCEIIDGDSSSNLLMMKESSLDCIYIDGDHFYEGVSKDIAAAYRAIKHNGLLFFNDYASWSPGSMNKCGVAKAANEFIIKTNSHCIALSLQGSGYHDICVRANKEHS